MEILTGRSKLIYDILASEDFDPEELKAELESGHYSPDELNRAACAYAFQCMDDYNTLGDDRPRGEIVPGRISSHYYDAIEIMLAFGLDPNGIIPGGDLGYNIMSETRYVVNGYEGARTLDLLLRHGGDPNIRLEGFSLIRDINFDVYFDRKERDDRAGFDALFHYWLVLLSAGARLEDGSLPVDVAEGFDISKLRDHTNYYWDEYAEYMEDGKAEAINYETDVVVREKATGREVVRQ